MDTVNYFALGASVLAVKANQPELARVRGETGCDGIHAWATVAPLRVPSPAAMQAWAIYVGERAGYEPDQLLRLSVHFTAALLELACLDCHITMRDWLLAKSRHEEEGEPKPL